MRSLRECRLWSLCSGCMKCVRCLHSANVYTQVSSVCWGELEFGGRLWVEKWRRLACLHRKVTSRPVRGHHLSRTCLSSLSCGPHKSLCVCMLSHFSCVRLFATPWTVVREAPLSMGFPRQESWSGLPFPSPGDLPHPGIEPRSIVSCTGRPVLYHQYYPGGLWGMR